MAYAAEQADRMDRLDDELQRATALVPDLFWRVIAEACTRIPALGRAGKAARIDCLVEAGAWTDAVFALIELETPTWKLRRLVREDGAWRCSLSRQPNLPVDLDDIVEASHESSALAVLRAFVEACRRSSTAPGTMSAVPRVRPTSDQIICCDNFA